MGEPEENRLDHSEARKHMDWQDQTGWKPDALDKAAATYRPLPHAPEAWALTARAGSGDLGAAEIKPVREEEVRLAEGFASRPRPSRGQEIGRVNAKANRQDGSCTRRPPPRCRRPPPRRWCAPLRALAPSLPCG